MLPDALVIIIRCTRSEECADPLLRIFPHTRKIRIIDRKCINCAVLNNEEGCMCKVCVVRYGGQRKNYTHFPVQLGLINIATQLPPRIM